MNHKEDLNHNLPKNKEKQKQKTICNFKEIGKERSKICNIFGIFEKQYDLNTKVCTKIKGYPTPSLRTSIVLNA